MPSQDSINSASFDVFCKGMASKIIRKSRSLKLRV